VSAELSHGNFKRYSGPGGGFLEKQRARLVFQGFSVFFGIVLNVNTPINHAGKLLTGQLREIEQMHTHTR
jgi:hypothetical protein